MIMEALASHFDAPPHVQLLLLHALRAVLPRIQRRRVEFIASCIASLRTRYLDAWRGDEWDDEWDEDEDGEREPAAPAEPASP